MLDLESAVTDLLSSYSLANDRVRALYVALSVDKIQDASVWPQFRAAAKLRGEVVHSGERAPPDQATAAVEAAEAFASRIGAAAR